MAQQTKRKTNSSKPAGSRNGSRSSGGKQTGRKQTGGKQAQSRQNSKQSRKQTGSRETAVKNRAAAKESIDYALVNEIVLWVIIALAAIMLIGMFGFGGVIGKTLANICFGLFGLGAYLFPFLLLFLSAFLISNFGKRSARIFALGIAGMYLTLCGVLQLILLGYNSGYRIGEYYQAGALYHTGGGFFGGILTAFFCQGLGTVGTFLVYLIMAMICLILITNKTMLARAARSSGEAFSSAKQSRARRLEQKKENRRLKEERKRQELRQRREEDEKPVQEETDYEDPDTLSDSFSILPTGRRPRMERKVTGVTTQTNLSPSFDLDGFQKDQTEDVFSFEEKGRSGFKEDIRLQADVTVLPGPARPEGVPSFLQSRRAAAKKKESVQQYSEEEMLQAAREADELIGRSSSDTDNEPAPVRETREKKEKKTKPSGEEIRESVDEVALEISQNEKAVPNAYVFPPLTLLKKQGTSTGGSTQAELRETAAKLQDIFKTFGVNVKVTNVTCGPSVTRYELMPEMGVKVSRIVSLQDDIKLNLAVTDIRIEAPIPGKAAVGIEVPNKKSTSVLLRDVLESDEFTHHRSNLAYAVGKDIAGKTIVSDIAKMPHLLIAGATGSGKSVFINTLIMSILYKSKPEDVKMIMIDPKVVELSVYNGIPHLFIPVVTDPKKAAGALNWAVAEMMQRYQKFADTGVRDLKGYNQRIAQLGDVPDKPEKMPQIVVIVDELADLMMVASTEVEDAICRLAQLARAAGIHLVIATQRPSVDVITGLIKANMPSRIAFSVSSGVDSRTILDSVGAEKLLGNGDMLFAPQTYKQPLRVQGAYVSDEEVASVVRFLKENGPGQLPDEEMQKRLDTVEKASLGTAGASSGGTDSDELFAQAGKFIIEKDKASIGMLQRWFKIGFNRAARIMDQLSDAGVVGPEEGTKPRKVLMSMEEFENYLEQN